MPEYQYADSLESDRIITRRLTLEDVPAWAEFFEDPEAIQFFPWLAPVTPEERARNWIETQLTRYVEQRFGLHALIEKETGQFIGQCGLLAQDVEGSNRSRSRIQPDQTPLGPGPGPRSRQAFFRLCV